MRFGEAHVLNDLGFDVPEKAGLALRKDAYAGTSFATKVLKFLSVELSMAIIHALTHAGLGDHCHERDRVHRPPYNAQALRIDRKSRLLHAFNRWLQAVVSLEDYEVH